MSPFDASRAAPGLPAVDHRLVAPETRFEISDGELVYVSPADAPHATRHAQVTALLEAHTGDDFEVAADMLTRTSRIDDAAPDISVYPNAPDLNTGGRQIEQLAFEIVSTESLGHAAGKAAKLIVRGVRRVFAVDIEWSRVLEWSSALGTWSMLDATGHIADPALEVPLPIDSLIHSAKADDAVARALLAKHNPVLEATRAQDRAASKQEGFAEGKQEGFAEAVIAVLEARGMALDSSDRERIVYEQDLTTLARWIVRAATCADTIALFEEPIG
jgi:putative restriction endonuclease